MPRTEIGYAAFLSGSADSIGAVSFVMNGGGFIADAVVYPERRGILGIGVPLTAVGADISAKSIYDLFALPE